MALRLALCALVWLLAMSCGGGSGPSEGSASSPTADDFSTRFARAWCTLLERCCSASGGVAEEGCSAETEAETITLGEEAMEDQAMWNSGAARLCLDAMADADCGWVDVFSFRELLDVCGDTWTGVVPPGEACLTYASCAEPMVEGAASPGASCVNGMCVQVVRLSIGEACSDDPLQICDPLLATCAGGVCVPLPDVGDACDDDCRSGLGCNDQGVCAPLLEMGEVCGDSSECKSDRCSAGQCVSIFAADSEYCSLP